MFGLFSKPLGAPAFALAIIALAMGGRSLAAPPRDSAKNSSESEAKAASPTAFQKATFGAGCFWCSDAVFRQLKGAHSVVAGYSGGLTEYPTYEQVCSGWTGHAEVVQITFDPEVISYDELLEVFWKTHDPTTLNQQGPDIGTQYRSVIFFHDDKQKKLAEHYKRELDKEHAFRKPIVTEIVEFEKFYPAEDYHQNYYNTHRGDAYCAAVVRPKVNKVKKVFKDKLSADVAKPHSR
jgi:peptide-methionine (S)-S-oxide reductase